MDYIETHYLIDFENVHGDGLTGCKDLGKTDHIVIFFTQNANKLDMSDISDHGDSELEMIKVASGNQSTDMHIVSYLGYLVGKYGKNCKVIIISKDTDYDNVIKFWKEKTGITISRKDQIKKKSTTKTKTATTNRKSTKAAREEKTKLNQDVMKAVSAAGFDASVANTTAQIAAGYFGEEHILSEVHNALRERYKNYLDVYSSVKPVLSKHAGDNTSKSATNKVTSKEKTSANSELQKILSKAGFSNDIVTYATSTAVKNLGVKNGKQQTYRTIISKYGQSKGLAIYNQIKNHI